MSLVDVGHPRVTEIILEVTIRNCPLISRENVEISTSGIARTFWEHWHSERMTDFNYVWEIVSLKKYQQDSCRVFSQWTINAVVRSIRQVSACFVALVPSFSVDGSKQWKRWVSAGVLRNDWWVVHGRNKNCVKTHPTRRAKEQNCWSKQSESSQTHIASACLVTHSLESHYLVIRRSNYLPV